MDADARRVRAWRSFVNWVHGRSEVDVAPLVERTRGVAEREATVSALDNGALAAIVTRQRGAAPSDEIGLFAAVREAARRTLNQRPYDEQVLAGLAMARGHLVEMQTGEGKTLAAVAPASLLALAGRGVHVLTANDYLARRDARWMGPLYRYLGLSVGAVVDGMPPAERRRAYSCDVTYVTAKEAGFDYLRDRLVLDPRECVQRSCHAAIVDEADSILIDEARLPLVIAGRTDLDRIDTTEIAEAVRGLRPARDYETDQAARNVSLTDAGVARVEERLGVEDLYSPANTPLLVETQNALHATVLLKADVDYIVRGGRVELVDELTGRVVEDRLWPDGLQAAIEGKEGVRARPEGRILGSMTMQHFLGLYPVLTGMTATARSSASELKEFYGLEVASIPTHRPGIRVDQADVVFGNRQAKLAAVVAEIVRVHDTGRPVLVGTASVFASEELARLLRRQGVECVVLNAKNDELEAGIVADAGKKGAVTISTNMAGRGTDIRLGGADGGEHAEVVALGGLHVVGTQRHESRRIDDQLRGRAGRQGDPGSSRFFVSLEDDLIERFGARNLASSRGVAAGGAQPIDLPLLHREIAHAQRVVDGENFDIRKTLHAYSAPLEKQRQFVHRWRQSLLRGDPEARVLERLRPERYRALAAGVGRDVLDEVERQIGLPVIDRCWSDHLAHMAELRTGIHLVRVAGKAPLNEFHRRAGQAFEMLLDAIEQRIGDTFDAVTVTPDGIDWKGERLRGPSSTWTYIVHDDPFDPNPLTSMSHSVGMAAGGAILWPLLLVWGMWERRRRRGRAARRSE